MQATQDTAVDLCFGNARVDAAQRRLLIDGKPAKLGTRAFDVLLALVERRDRAVSKDELFEIVWPGLVVEENNLQVHISALRKLLGPQAIATIPGRGYRFAANLNSSPPDTTPVTQAPAARPPERELYGRADDLSAVVELLREHALVSIVGAGGIGKTRLAQAVTAAQRERSVGDVWWVDLSQLTDGSAVPAAIAHAIGVRASDDRPILQTVIALLRDARSLLVLDNCEHLLEAVTECARALLAESRGLRLLVTTQEALNAPEERLYRLRGLPSESASGTPAAVALFVARAQAANPQLRVTDGNLAAIADICRRLDGLPLAIELAAARVRLLGIDGVRSRLDERFRVLSGGTRAVLRRHQTLRATLEWSHNLLSPEEQAVFRRLGVFVGGFTLELAQAVARDEHTDAWAVLDLLGHLVDKSMVVADGDEQPRYRLLETTRVFALEQLAAADETSALLRRHAEALLSFLQRVDDQHWTWSPAEQKRHGAELDNLRAALDWASAATEMHVLACAIFASSRRIWIQDELMNAGVERGLRLLPLPEGLDIEVEARFNLALGFLGYLGGRRECFVAALRAAELYRSLGDMSRLIDSLITVAQVGVRRGEAQQAAAALAEAQSLITTKAPPRQTASLALGFALHYLYTGQYEQAIASGLQQAAIYRESGNEWGEQLGLMNAAWYGCALGRIDQGIAGLKQAIASLQRLDAPYGIGNAQTFLACAHALRGDSEQALAIGRDAVPHLQRAQNVAWTLPFMALPHARRPGSEANAAALVGYFDAELLRLGRSVHPFATEVRERVMSLVQSALGAEQALHQVAVGAALTEEQAVTLAFGSSGGGSN